MKLKIASYLVPMVRSFLPRVDKEFKIDNSSSVELGLKYIDDYKKSIAEMAHTIIDFQLVKDTRKK